MEPIPVSSDCWLRPMRSGDAKAIAHHANDERIASQLLDSFPHPYYREHAVGFLEHVAVHDPPQTLAIAHGSKDELIGCIGVTPQTDVSAHTAIIGYWVGAEHWGRGIATASLVAMTRHLFEAKRFRRLFAYVFSSNPGSRRVLEKAGYAEEGCMRGHVVKHGVTLDQWVYGALATDWCAPDR